MELVNTNNEDTFDPTPKLKSSPIPILFVSFNVKDDNCNYCGDEYTMALFCNQKYCIKCLSRYITDITDNNIYLDVYIFTKNLECSEHEISKIKVPQNIQECCGNCLEILYFKQIFSYYINRPLYDYTNIYNKVIESEQYCKLCGKSFQTLLFSTFCGVGIRLCSNCYLISTGWIESTFTNKKQIPVIFLPWWDYNSTCCTCNSKLTFTSDCQKHCRNCYIYYTGCRYCLTTNIIFGVTNQSQCKKCQRISYITNFSSGNSYLDDFLYSDHIHDDLKITDFADQIKSLDGYFIPTKIYQSIYDKCHKVDEQKIKMEWIPYFQFTNVREIAKGGFGTIYQATWSNGSISFGVSTNETIVLKRLENSQDVSKGFLNELKSNNYCYKEGHHIIRIYGISKDPELEDYILVMKYASGGDLHNYLQKHFMEITWSKQKLAILWQISEGLETIHGANFIHRDFHSGNILFDKSSNKLFNNKNQKHDKWEHKRNQWKVGDLGLSQPVNDTSNDEIYGVIPYVAPEIFMGSTFSKESDVYSIGMILWELTTGCKPFANVEHDEHLIIEILDGKRPEITEDTPECFANLMKSCWDPDPKKRPSINEIKKKFSSWFLKSTDIQQFNKAEEKRLELIKLKKLSPEFTKKPHPKAFYTSRPLSFLISKCSSMINNSLLIDYNTIELKLDIDTNANSSSSFATSLIKRNIDELCDNNDGKRINRRSKMLKYNK